MDGYNYDQYSVVRDGHSVCKVAVVMSSASVGASVVAPSGSRFNPPRLNGLLD